MSTHICPNCNEDTFTWFLDDEISDLTIWGCWQCGYRAFEDESLERECSNCGKKLQSRLKDDDKEYWWCFNCKSAT